MLPQGGAGTFPEAVVRAQENIDGMWKLLVRLAALRDRLDELLHGPSPEATVAGADYAAGTRGLKGSLEHQAELLATIGGVFDQIEAQL